MIVVCIVKIMADHHLKNEGKNTIRPPWTFSVCTPKSFYTFTNNRTTLIVFFCGKSVYSFIWRLKNDCFSYQLVSKRLICDIPFFSTLLWRQHLTLNLSATNYSTVQCKQSFLKHNFCRCQYLFVFRQTEQKQNKKIVLSNFSFNLPAFAAAEHSAV